MIGVATGTQSFGKLARYLTNGQPGTETERVAWSASRNLPTNDPELAGKIMRATASQNVRVQQPAYHLTLSCHPEDSVDRVTIEGLSDRTIAALGLSGHQTLMVCHRDRAHPHVHLLINRVHPETGRAWSRWRDRLVIQKVLLEEEIALGLRITPGHLASLERSIADFSIAAGPRLSAAQPRELEGVRPSELAYARTKFTLAEGIRAYLGVHSRVAALNRKEYEIQLETSAARVRSTRLEEAVELAERAGSIRKTWTANLDPLKTAPLGERGLLAPDETLNRTRYPGTIESEMVAARAERQRAESRAVAIQRELRSLPDRPELERRILRLLERMSPKEIGQLRLALSAPQVALMFRLRNVIRDTALGRDEMQCA